ncbi:MAG: hypothetical protein O2U61_04925 [Candidatus Bathyarchaeota archaeon]|nr:hypothetical protein [Candidatus Bathyarchaeota archaeon]
MKINEFIRQITEVQSMDFVLKMSQDNINKIEKNLWLIWKKIRSIKDMDMIDPLLKLSESFTKKEFKDGRIKLRTEFYDINFFYDECIKHIPKKKYTFIYPKYQKKKNYDYEFLKYLAKDLNESISNCEKYHDIYKELGTLEREKKKIFTKYGIEYQEVKESSLEPIRLTSLQRIKQYEKLSDKVKKKGYKSRKKLMGNTSMRSYIYEQTGLSQSQHYKLSYIKEHSPQMLDRIDSGELTVRNVYHELKGLDKRMDDMERLRRELKRASTLISKEQLMELMDEIL